MADPKIPTPRECGRALWWLVRYAHHIVFVDGAEVKNGKGKVIEESTRSTRVVVAGFTGFLLVIFGKRYPDVWWWAGGVLFVAVFGLAATGDFTDEKDDDQDPEDEAGEEEDQDDGEGPGETEEKTAPADTKAAGENLTLKILRYVNIHTSGGTKGVHLDALAVYLDLSLTAVREHCEREGFEVVSINIKRNGDQSNKIGIRRDFLERHYGAPLPTILQQLEPPPAEPDTFADIPRAPLLDGVHILRPRPSPDPFPATEAG
ncbi:hypothetical protein EF910_32115 [Streptomyces sp. WAC07149]|uniref:hypothetical protein n=1 Tax=Streptomyces sp. WAC07149 TaxID=2487425 RepID=UPI000F79ED4E|nr:hypothetical protein [Streptomyces sp. WAC07149]RST00382.1 hypothetical protein EF910_32115 [Streptomyces sp. WAC07149]